MSLRQASTPLSLLFLLLVPGLASCDSSPSTEMKGWSLTRSGKTYSFAADANLLNGDGGWFSPRLTLTDERGCKSFQALDVINPITAPDPTEVDGRFRGKFDYKWRIASAQLDLVHTVSEGSGFAEEVVFSDDKVIDPSLSPPEFPTKPCSTKPTRAELRERAKTDPEGADAEAIGNMSRNEVMATAINAAGFLCARVTDMYPSAGAIVVSCVENRSGGGRVKYRVNASAGSVEQLD